MKIGNIEIDKPVISAPLAGISDRAFREISRTSGCHMVCSEMLSSMALIYANKKTITMSTFSDVEKPIIAQIAGSRPDIMTEAAKIVESLGADMIDINSGCSVKKIIRNHEGSYLLKDIGLFRDIVRATVNAVKIPVTVKIRKAWCGSYSETLNFARIAESEGISAITIHGRRPSDKFMGKADWEIVKFLKENLSIPVIGNGDIKSFHDAKEIFEKTGCDGIMIGRASMGNPWIFSQIVSGLKGEKVSFPDYKEKINTGLKHYHMLLEYKGEAIALFEMRKHLSWYIKGLKDAARIREKICAIDDYKTIIELMENYRDNYLAYGNS